MFKFLLRYIALIKICRGLGCVLKCGLFAVLAHGGARVSADTVKGACDLETLSHDRCPDNVYERKEYSPPEDPCFPHKKERYEL